MSEYLRCSFARMSVVIAIQAFYVCAYGSSRFSFPFLWKKKLCSGMQGGRLRITMYTRVLWGNERGVAYMRSLRTLLFHSLILYGAQVLIKLNLCLPHTRTPPQSHTKFFYTRVQIAYIIPFKLNWPDFNAHKRGALRRHKKKIYFQNVDSEDYEFIKNDFL